MSILNGFTKYKKAIKQLAAEENCNSILPLIDSIWTRFKYGCTLNHYIVGNFHKRSRFERKKIFTYRHWCKIVSTVNAPSHIHYLCNKVDFNTFFKEFIRREWLYSKQMSFSDFESFCKKHRQAIIKPMNGLEGNGIMLKNMPKNSDEVNTLFEKYKSSDILIEENIIQHHEMVFGNKSVNTIRVYTVMNNKTGEVSIVKTVVRAGVGSSIVDNSHQVGCAYEIDKAHGYIISPYYASNGLTSYIHPNTDICMLGKQIPFWSDVKEICIKAAKKIPECRYIGWDIAIKEDGPLIIEGNHMPDLDMIEFVGSYGYFSQIMKGLGL